MKRDSTRGWRDVFSFTFVQTIKSKAYRVGLGIMLVLVLVSMPLMNYLTAMPDYEEGGDVSSIRTVYVYNMTMYRNLDIESELTQGYRDVSFTAGAGTVEAAMKEELAPDEVRLVILEDEEACYLQFVRSPESSAGLYELQLLGQCVQNAYQKAKLRTLGISESQRQELERSVLASAAVVDTESALVLEDTTISMSEYWFVYAVLFIILMVSVMSSSQVASSIVSDKSSKVVEYLLTSVRPLAIIVGKVLAMLLSVMLQIVALILAGVVSVKVGEALLGGAQNAIVQYLSPEILANLTFGNLVLGLLTAAAGIVFYATLAGLCGATVSRMEEASEALTLLTVASLVGAYIGIGACASMMAAGENAFVVFALIFPLSSAFLLPGALLIGKASIWVALLAIVVLLLSVLLLFRFVARVYETLILYNGKRMKLKEVFAISKRERQREAR